MKPFPLDSLLVPEGRRISLADYPTDAFTAKVQGRKLDKDMAEAALPELEAELAEWQAKLYAEGKQSLLIVLQARDAGGKDSVVARVMGDFNPNGVRISNFKRPSELELAHDFLWRIHLEAPRKGMIAVFNRSHYEDVLVTRVHGLIDDDKARQNLEHIANFEKLLTDNGTAIVKFYLHLSPEEQKERLLERLHDPSKHWKFEAGDLQERALWHEYTAAFEDALSTSCPMAPWYVIPADRKWLRDYLITQVLLHTFRQMNPRFPEASFQPSDYAIPEV